VAPVAAVLSRSPLGKIFRTLIVPVRFAADSALEEAGFEPTVPREKGYILRPSLAIMTASFSRKASVRSLPGPRVRIFFPPAVSHVRTDLNRRRPVRTSRREILVGSSKPRPELTVQNEPGPSGAIDAAKSR
jgi:hypothetical protein